MPTTTAKNTKTVVQFIVDTYYSGSVEEVARRTGYTASQIRGWIAGTRKPHKQTIDYLLQCVFTPEFSIIAEYSKFDSNGPLQTQLKSILGDHKSDPGIYAFYDSRGSLIYLGKATNLLAEITSAMNRPVHIEFPKGVRTVPAKRLELIAYISAYDVGNPENWGDYPKHVEALILRISKPSLNKNIGSLGKARKPYKEA